jgi:hypothetical protein
MRPDEIRTHESILHTHIPTQLYSSHPISDATVKTRPWPQATYVVTIRTTKGSVTTETAFC